MKKSIFLLGMLIGIAISLQAQNVGIGINNPTRAKLEVHGAVDATSAIFGGESTGVSLQRNWPGVGFNSYYNNGHRYMANGFAALQFVDPDNGYMSFDMSAAGNRGQVWNGYNRILTLLQSGNVAIGPNFPNSSLSVSRVAGVDATLHLQGTVHHSSFNFGTDENTYIRAGKDNGIVFLNDIPNSKVVMNGPVGINTSTPVFPLEIRQVSNRGIALIEPTNFNYWNIQIVTFTGNLDFYAGNNGGQFIVSNGNYQTYSDRRLKTSIQSLPAVLSNLLKLQPVKYNMINNPSNQKSIGFIAQDVKPLFKQIVNVLPGATAGYKNLEDVHSMNYGSLSVISIKAIQEQQLIINGQQAMLLALQAEYEQLKKAVDELMQNTSKTK